MSRTVRAPGGSRRRAWVLRIALGLFAVPVLALIVLLIQAQIARSRVYLTAAEAPSPVGVRGSGPDFHLLVVGDSTAVGVGAMTTQGMVADRLAQALADQGRHVRLTVRAVSGARTADLAGQLADVVTLKADLVVMLVGANDSTHLVTPDTVRRNVAAAVATARATGARVVVGTCPDMGAKAILPPLRQVLAAYGRRIATAEAAGVRAGGGVPVPLDTLVGHQFREDPDTMLSTDDFHPSDEGYRLWAEALLPAVMEQATRPPG